MFEQQNELQNAAVSLHYTCTHDQIKMWSLFQMRVNVNKHFKTLNNVRIDRWKHFSHFLRNKRLIHVQVSCIFTPQGNNPNAAWKPNKKKGINLKLSELDPSPSNSHTLVCFMF